ncbi:MAG: ribosomal protein S18-alanine N-acetyltransferase [Candidatus Brockarchaeota archaeon]|nr:ribosomal protein S18-alanine N-acetyltransferase [Candidatus Brockarchaeota archaeon]
MFEENHIVIEEATEKDLEAIIDIEKSSFPGYPYSIEIFRTLLKDYGRYFLVSRSRGVVVGYICGRIFREKFGEIVSIAVIPDFRRKGIGRKLMLELESRFKKDGIKFTRLEVSVRNTIAIKFYGSLGYEIMKLTKNYYPDGSDALTLIKFLEEDNAHYLK